MQQKEQLITKLRKQKQKKTQQLEHHHLNLKAGFLTEGLAFTVKFTNGINSQIQNITIFVVDRISRNELEARGIGML